MKDARSRPCRLLVLLTAPILLISVLILPISADFGPKPSLTVTVTNPPEEPYYLDLLIPTEPEKEYYSNLYEDELARYPAEVVDLFRDYDLDGWRTALTHGTRIPLFGDLQGVRQEDGSMEHHFSYYATPTEYRLIFLTSDGEIHVSPVVERQSFHQTLTYDFAAGEVVARTSIPRAYLVQFAMTCLCTLLIEGVLLFVFGFAQKGILSHNLRVFVILNLLTQIVLTAVTGSALIFDGELSAYFALILCEIVIFVLEAIVFARLLKGHSRGRRVAYALTANLLSAVMSWVLIAPEAAIIF